MQERSRSDGLPLVLAVAATVAACGVPVVDPDGWVPDFGIHGDHGAIAVSYANSAAALTARYLNQGDADARALELCASGCEIALRFEGEGQCGSAASSANGTIGVGSGKPQAAADAAALENCRQEGGTECVVKLQGCND